MEVAPQHGWFYVHTFRAAAAVLDASFLCEVLCASFYSSSSAAGLRRQGGGFPSSMQPLPYGKCLPAIGTVFCVSVAVLWMLGCWPHLAGRRLFLTDCGWGSEGCVNLAVILVRTLFVLGRYPLAPFFSARHFAASAL